MDIKKWLDVAEPLCLQGPDAHEWTDEERARERDERAAERDAAKEKLASEREATRKRLQLEEGALQLRARIAELKPRPGPSRGAGGGEGKQLSGAQVSPHEMIPAF